MSPLFADQSVEISAPASAVWTILTDPRWANRWADAFAQATIESDWRLGNPVLWKKADGTVFVEGTVTAVEPAKILRFTVISTEDAHRALTRSAEDGITFMLTEKNGTTTLRVRHGDFSVLADGQEALRGTTEGWKKVLPMLQEWAEALVSKKK